MYVTTSAEVAKLLAALPSKSSSVDYIPASLLKSCTVFAELISKLTNQSCAEGHFPGRFKFASVTPLLKLVSCLLLNGTLAQEGH